MIEENLHEVLRSIEESRAKRTIADAKEPVRLVAVTKNHGVAEMREAIAHGVTDIGENRIQEAREKRLSARLYGISSVTCRRTRRSTL